MPDKLSVSTDGVLGFAQWLSELDEPIVVGAQFESERLFELAREYCEQQGVSDE